MLILEFGQVVDVLVDNDVEIIGFVVGGHIGRRESLGHVVDSTSLLKREVYDGSRLMIQESLQGTKRSEMECEKRANLGYCVVKNGTRDEDEAGPGM